MAYDLERPAAEDTVVVDADENSGRDEEWPVAEFYRVEPVDDVGGERRATEEGTLVITAPPDTSVSAKRELPGLGVALLAVMLAFGAILLGAVLLSSHDEVQSPRRAARATSTTPPPTQTETTPTSPADTVPSLDGMSVAEARGVLNDLHVRARIRTAPSQKPRGVVLRQEPAKGAKVTPGSVVSLVVSSGSTAETSATVSVPTVVGRMASIAAAELRDAGLVAKIHLVSSTQRAGVVVRQSPEGAAEVTRGSKIRLDVARARAIPPRIEVPDLMGLDVTDARRQIAGLGLMVEIVQLSSAQPVGTVLRQAPRAGGRLAEKGRVTLTVSSGLERIDVPDVAGLDEETARAELESAGFDVRVSYEPTSDPTLDGSVLRQTPAGGTTAGDGSVVTIVVAQVG
jgi:beta-lactam-binding protein with PASTA domain